MEPWTRSLQFLEMDQAIASLFADVKTVGVNELVKHQAALERLIGDVRKTGVDRATVVNLAKPDSQEKALQILKKLDGTSTAGFKLADICEYTPPLVTSHPASSAICMCVCLGLRKRQFVHYVHKQLHCT